MRIRLLTLLAIIGLAPNILSATSLPSWCVDAYSSGDTEKGDRFARQISMGKFRYSPDDAKLAEECLTEHTGVEVTYVPELRGFFHGDELAAALEKEKQIIADREAKRLAEEADQAEREKSTEEAKINYEKDLAEMRKRKRIADRKKQEKEREAKKAAELRAKLAEERRIERIFAVRQKLGEACERLYRRSEDQAITNNLCFEYFLEYGLPVQ